MNDFFTKSTIPGDIYRFLYFNGQSSRQEISNTLGISLPTTTRNLNALQEEGMMPVNLNQPAEGKLQSTNVFPTPATLLESTLPATILLSY